MFSQRHEPTLVPKNPFYKPEWIQIVCGGSFTAGLTKDGKVFTWGINYCGQLGHNDTKNRITPTKVDALEPYVIVQIACGANHIAVLTDNGEVFIWYVLLE